MEIKESPMCSGISELTGKMIKVRHATEGDMVFIVEMMKKYRLDTEGLHFSQFVVAAENGNITGFGRLKRTGDLYSIGCVVVVEERRGEGIESLIVKHLIDIAPVKLIYAVTDLAGYFGKLGFVELKEGAKELYDELDRTCRINGRKDMVLMVYEKK